MNRKNPKDALAKSLAKLRAEVRTLASQFKNEVRYSDKKFKELDRSIYDLKQLVLKVIGSV